MTSPQKNKPDRSLDSIVDGSISSVETPPEVTIASFKGLKDLKVKGRFFMLSTILILSSFVI